MRISRITAARLVTVSVLSILAGSAVAQQVYPSKPIRLIVPFSAGGNIDLVARIVGQKLGENLGQQLIVDNRPGGNTIIGTETLVKAAPGGYTLMQISSTLVITPHLLPNLPYDTIRDITPVTTVSSSELMLVIHPSVPANTLQELIKYAKSKPGELNYASAATGGVPHLACEQFSIMTGIKMQHIPYKGGAPAVTDLLGGRVQVYFSPPLSILRHIESGKLRAIAISGDARWQVLPKLPTFTEGGLANFDVKFWQGVFAPAGTQKAIVDRLAAEISKILIMPDIREKLASQGGDPLISTPEKFAALVRADLVKYGKIIKTANIKLEN